jgi:hypothetical protein
MLGFDVSACETLHSHRDVAGALGPSDLSHE